MKADDGKVAVVINGQTVRIDRHKPITFRMVCELAGVTQADPSMTWRGRGYPERTMSPGHAVWPVQGMEFTVAATTH